MRKLLLSLALVAACSTVPSRAPGPTPATEQPAVEGLTIDEEASVLALEDRRAFDPEIVNRWIAHPNALHRMRIALALGRIGPQTFIDTNGNGQRDAGERQAGVEQLIGLASDPDRNVRELAAFALGEIGDISSIDTLFRFANDADGGVAAEAVEALSKLAKDVPLARFIELTAAAKPEGIRARAIRFLFRWNTDEASAMAAKFLEEAAPAIRQEASYVLARRAFAPARERVELLATDPSTPTRAYAAAALGRIGAKESIPVLVSLLGDIHPWVRTNAAVAIARVAAKDATAIGGPEVAKDIPRIVALTEDPDPGTRASSVDTLGYYATSSDIARTRLFEIARNGSRWEREIAAAAIARHFRKSQPDLIPVGDLPPWGKVRVLESSAQLDASGAAIRKRYAADPDPMVRANAIGNIPEGAEDAEMEIIRPALADTDVIVRANAIEKFSAAKRMSPEAKMTALQAAEERSRTDELDDARLSAIKAIVGMDFMKEPFLRGLLADDDPVVRRLGADLIEEQLKQPRPQYTPLPSKRTAADYAAIVAWSRKPHTATIHMTRGLIEIALLPMDAPITAWNFAQLAQRKYFDDTTFMRVVPNFVIQGGDPRNDQNGGPGYAIRDEINLQKYTRGAVGMALSGPDTGGSQFFITHSPQPHLDGGYTIFGRVYDGMGGVVDQTERGDRVETITIDEHSPAGSPELASAQKTPLPTEIGETSVEHLMRYVPEYTERRAEYKPDETVLQMIADAIKPGDRVEIYLGTWCSDSQREVPRFLKIVDLLGERFHKELPLRFVAVDRSKSKPAPLLAGKSIDKVATFIYYRGGVEIGRIVEKPEGLIEDHLLTIVSK